MGSNDKSEISTDPGVKFEPLEVTITEIKCRGIFRSAGKSKEHEFTSKVNIPVGEEFRKTVKLPLDEGAICLINSII